MTLARAVRAESTKLLTLPLFLYTAAGTVLLSIGFSWITTALVASALAAGKPEETGGLDAGSAFLTILHFGQIGVILLGAWTVHQELDSGSLRSTLIAVPQRSAVFAAKALVVSGGVLLTAIPSVVGSTAVRCVAVDCSTEVARIAPDVLLGVVLYWILIALFTYALSVILRSGLAAMSAVLALALIVSTYLLPITPAAKFLPDQAGAQLYQQPPVPVDALGPVGGGLVLLAWVAAAMGGAVVLFIRQPVRS
ncbi:hypothetical protein ACIPY3_17610 [Paenarthrobacter sp. NPDC089714]|uniref:hypothetical protein n=1 Tax=Paenarthrobacter sp. NPDC089714 TaxID=3364377 RepID=UPI0037F60667